MIDRLYRPRHRDLDEALGRHDVGVNDVVMVISSHLHFDHCGQNNRFRTARIVVQRIEAETARAPRYTVPDWAEPPGVTVEQVDGAGVIAPGVSLLPTPGHTAGHQSVVVHADDDSVDTVICAQASWDATAFDARSVGDEHAWDVATGDSSVEQLHRLAPKRVLFSHDAQEWAPDA